MVVCACDTSIREGERGRPHGLHGQKSYLALSMPGREPPNQCDYYMWSDSSDVPLPLHACALGSTCALTSTHRLTHTDACMYMNTSTHRH